MALIDDLKDQILSGQFGNLPPAGGGSLGDLLTQIAAKLDGTISSYANDTAALAATPTGRARIGKVAGQLALIANDGGTLLKLPFVTSTDLDA